jgi:NTP pyrophosphatase (non-canonical NTP hydrolase)
MDINTYQAKAADTMQFDVSNPKAISISMFGLSGEVGELATEYKKRLRDGDNYKIFKDKIMEELGDIMWYLSSIATLENIQMSDILEGSIRKAKDRWESFSNHGQMELEGEFLDDGRDENEQFPREFVAEFKETEKKNKNFISVTVNGASFGDPIRDNAYDDDYYRFHDIFHFSYVTALGWSPVTRGLLKLKRKSDSQLDEIEDGGRAVVIDESISILVFEYARHHNFFKGVGAVDYQLLRTIKMLSKHLEVKNCTPKQWEHAILIGFDIWHKLKANNGGRVICNMQEKSMTYESL